MTAQHQSSSTNNSVKCNFNVESGMVAVEKLTGDPKKEEIRIEEWSEDVESISSKNPDSEDETSETGQEIITTDECTGNFGNIVVKNSSDVQFGNNTYYQGPVTIKQFVYKGADSEKLELENGGKNNLGFKADTSEDYVDSFTNSNQNIIKPKHTEAEHVGGSHWLNTIYENRKIFSIYLLSILAALVILLVTILLVNKNNYVSESPNNTVDETDRDEQENNVPIPPPSGESTLSGKLKIIPRIEWLAQPPEQTPNQLELPVPYIIILHTATENCTDQAKCTAIVRYIQTYHMESKGWWDIGYNFLVGGDGYVYEGRGWKSEGANVFGWNKKSVGIAFVGTFNKILPPNRQILACKQLVEKGVKDGYVAKNYKLFAHRQLSSTQSPGEALYENIKTWPHWAEKPDEVIP